MQRSFGSLPHRGDPESATCGARIVADGLARGQPRRHGGRRWQHLLPTNLPCAPGRSLGQPAGAPEIREKRAARPKSGSGRRIAPQPGPPRCQPTSRQLQAAEPRQPQLVLSRDGLLLLGATGLSQSTARKRVRARRAAFAFAFVPAAGTTASLLRSRRSGGFEPGGGQSVCAGRGAADGRRPRLAAA